jgi:uncharacterized membrane protein YdjX (TVP38/TMEM64 family)
MEAPSKPKNLIPFTGRTAAISVLVILLVIAITFLFATESGSHIRHDPQGFALEFRGFVHRHAIAAPLAFIGLYVVLATISWPIWWLQLLAGASFGLYEGTFLSVLASTISAAIAVALARWIAADWFHQRVESHMHRLKALDEKLGHNGLLFIMSLRLVPLMPFGLVNYAIGFTKVSFTDVILGTLLGAIPVLALHVGIGAGYQPWINWRFDLSLGSLTFVLFSPLILRYLRPKWFEKIGVE